MPAALLRLLFTVLISGALVAVYLAVTRLVLAKAGSGVRKLAAYVAGLPAVVLFTTPSCAVCKAAQRPALATLKDRLADRVQVIEIDALENRELAEEWSVFSVPTTFVVDRKGVPRQVNQGFASADKLLGQLQLVL